MKLTVTADSTTITSDAPATIDDKHKNKRQKNKPPVEGDGKKLLIKKQLVWSHFFSKINHFYGKFLMVSYLGQSVLCA